MPQPKVILGFDSDIKSIGTVEEVERGEVDSSIAAFVRDVVDSIHYGSGYHMSRSIRISIAVDEKGVTRGI